MFHVHSSCCIFASERARYPERAGGGGGARVFQPWRKLWDTGNQNSNNFIDKYMVLRWVKPHPTTSGLTPSSNVAGLFDIIMET